MAKKIETLRKEEAQIQEWLTKKSVMLEKKLAAAKKAGYLENFTIEGFESSAEVDDMFNAEIRKAFAKDEKPAVIDNFYSVLTILEEVERKTRTLSRTQKQIAEIEEVIAATVVTPEMAKELAERESQKALHAYIKEELNTISIPSLDAWLAKYKEAYIAMAELNYTGWEQSHYLREAEAAVTAQKLNLVIRAWEKVGRVTDVQFGTVGIDGSFNGHVTGEKGSANIRTILAGGYNIQRLHYRVLVN